MSWEYILKSRTFIEIIGKLGYTAQTYSQTGVFTNVETSRQIEAILPSSAIRYDDIRELEEWAATFVRSIEFVTKIVDSNDDIEWRYEYVSVKGSSGKRYNINSISMNNGCYEVTTIEGYNICIQLTETLPAGDNLAGLILTLLDDKSSSKTIEGIRDYLDSRAHLTNCAFDNAEIKLDLTTEDLPQGLCPECGASYRVLQITFEPGMQTEEEFFVEPLNADGFEIDTLTQYEARYDENRELFYFTSPRDFHYKSRWERPKDWNDEEDFLIGSKIIAFRLNKPPFFTTREVEPLKQVPLHPFLQKGMQYGNMTLFIDGRELTSSGVAKYVRHESGRNTDFSDVKFIKFLFDFFVDYPFYYENYMFPMIIGFEETENKEVYEFSGKYVEIILQSDKTHTVKYVGNPDTYEFYKSQKNLSSIAILDNNMKWTQYLKKSSTDNMQTWETALKSFIEEGKKIGVPLSVMEILQLAKEATTSQSEGFETLHRPTFSEDEEEEEDV